MHKVMKRIIDIVASSVALILLSPILAVIALLVYIKLGSPIVFTQERIGQHGKNFKMIKFRTMLNTTDAKGKLLPTSERLTPFGKKLRSTSLDELPELWNVLTGTMSLVGPRPLLTEYRSFYSPTQFRRHEVKPGITGWAQINGRNHLTWNERFKLDVWYVDHYNVLLDFKILLLTVWKVVKREGINQQGDVIMEKFNGTN